MIADPHVAARNMLVEMPAHRRRRPSRSSCPGNPVKLSKVAEGPEHRVPWVGEHTEEVLRTELGLPEEAVANLRADGVVT